MAGSDFIPFAPRQLDGAIDYAAWRRMLRAMSSLRDEVAIVKRVEARTTGSRDLAEATPEAAVMSDAWDAVATTVRDVLTGGVDTASLAYWEGMADAVRCATRLTSAPEYSRGTAATTRDMVLAVAFLLDMSFRNADPELRATAAPPDDGRRQKARVASVYVDLMVGRGPAWTCACMLNAAVAATAAGDDAVALDTSWRATRTGDVIRRVQSQTGLGGDDASGQALATLAGAAFVIDQRQSDAYDHEKARPDADIASCLRQQALVACGPAIVAMCQHMGRLDASCRGYLAALNMSPSELVASLNADYDQALRESHVAMLNDEAAKAGARSIDDGRDPT